MDFKSILYIVGIFLGLIFLAIVIRTIGIFVTLILVVAISAIAFFLLIAFTSGFSKGGRLMGGLFALVGKPGAGKTYCATAIGLQRMKEGRLVFSNYSIVSVDGEYCSRVIEGVTSTGEVIEKIHELMAKNLNRAVLIFDEAHLFWWSRDFKKFTQQDKNFFTFLAQHEIEVYYIVQHENRMDTIANDCAALFGVVDKWVIPFIDKPIRFIITWWSAEEEIRQSLTNPNVVPFDTESFWFNKDVASAYDTRFFGHDRRPRYKGILWTDFMLKYHNRPWLEPQDVSIQTYIRRLPRKLRNFDWGRRINGLLYYWVEEHVEILKDRALATSWGRKIIPNITYVVWWVWCFYVFNCPRILQNRWRE